MITNGETISTAKFLQCLRRLNPSLRVFCGDNDNRLAGLFVITKAGQYEQICGVDKKFVPAYTSFDDGGHVVKSGWRRVFRMLLELKYTTIRSVEAVNRGFFDTRARAYDRETGGVFGDQIQTKLEKFARQNLESGDELLTTEQVLDVAQDIHKKDSEQQKQEREKDIWFLEKWKDNGGGPNEKPNY